MLRRDSSERDGLIARRRRGTTLAQNTNMRLLAAQNMRNHWFRCGLRCRPRDPTSNGNHTNHMEKHWETHNFPAEKDWLCLGAWHCDWKGDIAESNTTANIFGEVPISSLKSYWPRLAHVVRLKLGSALRWCTAVGSAQPKPRECRWTVRQARLHHGLRSRGGCWISGKATTALAASTLQSSSRKSRIRNEKPWLAVAAVATRRL